MFLHKRKASGYYYLFYKDESGKQRSVSTRQKKKSDALAYLKDFREREREKQRRVLYVSLSDFIPEYLQHSKSIHTVNSHNSAASALREFIRIVGDMPLSKVSIRDVERFLAVKREMSVHTARRNFVTVAAAFQKAVDWNYLTDNPFRKVRKPKAPEAAPLFFTKPEFIRLTETIESVEWVHFVTVAVMSGLRLSELLNLKWEHVDIPGRVVNVVNTSEFQTKSKRNRKVPMNNLLVSIFTERREQAACEYVFHRQGRKLAAGYVSKRFKRYVLASGVNPRLHFHSLRHTCASWLVQAGVSIYVVQQVLGHSNVSVTSKYAHLEHAQLSDAVSRLHVEGVREVGAAA
jgi:integrase